MAQAKQLARGARHFIYVSAREDAEAICGVLEREGWETHIDADDNVALVSASCLRVLTTDMARDARVRLASLAAQHGGSYDGCD